MRRVSQVTQNTPYLTKDIEIRREPNTGESRASIKGWLGWVCLKAECREDAITEAKRLLENPL